MRLPLHRIESNCFRLIYENEISSEETSELVIPDVSEDVARILDARGQVFVTSKKVGAEKLSISAAVKASVIYCTEGDENVECIKAEIPFDVSVPVNGLNEDARVTVSCELCRLDAKLLNPRKVLIIAEVKFKVCCFVPDMFVIWDELTDTTDCKIHYLQKSVEHSLVSGIREKTFTVSDEYSIPPDRDPNSKLMSTSTEVCVEDTKSVGNKLVFKALVKTTALFLCATSGEPFECMFETLFSQIIETDSVNENSDACLIPLMREVEFTRLPTEGKNGCFAVSFNICAQAVCREQVCSSFIADAYSNTCELKAETMEISARTFSMKKHVRMELKGMLPDEVSGTSVLYLSPVSVCTHLDKGCISCQADVRGVYLNENGQMMTVAQMAKGSDEIVLSPGQMMKIISVCCDPVVINRDKEICFEVCIELSIHMDESFEVVCALEAEDNCCAKPETRSSLTVVCSNRPTNLWVLAKKYGSTMELIEKANCVDGEFDINKRPILIPRA